MNCPIICHDRSFTVPKSISLGSNRASLGQRGTKDAYSEKIDRWVEANPTKVPEELRQRALKAIDRITGEHSELSSLWEGSEDWIKAVMDLKSRVHG
jgi:hypothetical protein